MSAIKAIAFVVGLTALYCVLIFIGFALAGAGHGTDYFGTALLAPFSAFSESLWVLFAGLVLWTLVSLLVAMRRFVWCRFAAAGMLVVHYIGVIGRSLQRADWDYVAQVLTHAWVLVVPLAAAYVASQGLMWSLITRRRHGA